MQKLIFSLHDNIANSAHPDQIPQYAISDHDQHCLYVLS